MHAGTALAAGRHVVSAGGRVLSVVALGDNLSQARERVYTAVARIGLDGSHHRTDIALAAERDDSRRLSPSAPGRPARPPRGR